MGADGERHRPGDETRLTLRDLQLRARARRSGYCYTPARSFNRASMKRLPPIEQRTPSDGRQLSQRFMCRIDEALPWIRFETMLGITSSVQLI